MVLLGSKFPKLRRHTAERLFFAGVAVQATTEESSCWKAGTAKVMCDILASAAWDADDIEIAKEARGRVVHLLALEPPKTKTVRGGARKAKSNAHDENASYQALVDDVARGMGM